MDDKKEKVIYGRGTNFSTSEPVESNPELEAVKRDYKVFTTIEQQLKDVYNEKIILPSEVYDPLKVIQTVLQVIEQHKADLFAKYNIWER